MGSTNPLKVDKVIRISEDTANMINQMKVHPRVSYNEVINFLAKNHLKKIEESKK